MQKFLGANPVCARLTGISMKKMGIIAFVLSGIGVGLGALLSIIYAPTLTRNTASSVGMDVIIAIVFGGMPVSGGARSKISSAVIGAFSMTLLNQIMTMLNLNSGIGQMVKAAIFILVVFLATSDQRGKLLPR
jgi:ribose transport system permease protein